MTITGQRIFSSLGDSLLDRIFETKNGFDFFVEFLYDLFINKVRKLELAVSNPIIEDIPVCFSLSLGWGYFPSLSRSRFISLSPLSFSLC